jgi:hypothetical protein
MKANANQITFPATLIMGFLVFLLLIVSGNTNLSYAASASKKTPRVERKTAVEHTETQIKQLESALNFTDSQKVLWNDVTKVMRENGKETDARHEARAIARAERIEKNVEDSAVERIKAHTENTEAIWPDEETTAQPFELYIPPLKHVFFPLFFISPPPPTPPPRNRQKMGNRTPPPPPPPSPPTPYVGRR